MRLFRWTLRGSSLVLLGLCILGLLFGIPELSSFWLQLAAISFVFVVTLEWLGAFTEQSMEENSKQSTN